MKKKNGFTLIELLAVIIILGILMIIAIPSVTRYINDSRKNAYIDTAKEIISGARNLVNEGKLEMYDTDTTYYIDQECIGTENASKSPYGDFTKAYVVVTYNGKGYDYYWTSVDDAGQGIRNLIKNDKLDIDNIDSDLNDGDISTLRGIDGRTKIIIVSKENNCKKGESYNASIFVNGETGEEKNPIEYPEGKDKSNVQIGDIVKIGTEEFYVINNSNNDLSLLAKYNLKIGGRYTFSPNSTYYYSENDEGYGMQDSSCLGDDYTGVYNCTTSYSESIVNNYLDMYKNKLKTNGVNIKSIRLPLISEKTNLPREIILTSSYWLGEIDSYSGDQAVVQYETFNLISCDAEAGFWVYGIRPVIVI